MSDRTDRVAAALELLSVMDGGSAPAPERLAGLTAEELRDAESLFAAGIDASRNERALQVVRMAYLVKHAPPGLSVKQALAALTDAQLAEFLALTEEDL